jgi:hypothetical protein
MSEQKNMSGVLFKNDRKEKDSHPDYTGSAMIHGQEFWMSAWIKEGRNGKFMSFSFRPKEARDAAQERTSDNQNSFGDVIPF